jgi:hypothetical protein
LLGLLALVDRNILSMLIGIPEKNSFSYTALLEGDKISMRPIFLD